MKVFLGDDTEANLQTLLRVDHKYYKSPYDDVSPVEHYVTNGRFDGQSAYAFDEAAYLSTYPTLLDGIRKQLKNTKRALSASELVSVFFQQRAKFPDHDFSDGVAEQKFWEIAAPEVDLNTLRYYEFDQKLDIFSDIDRPVKEACLAYFVEHQDIAFLGNDVALILSSFAMTLNRPITAEYFLLLHKYGVAWSYPSVLEHNLAVYPVVTVADYLAEKEMDRYSSEDIDFAVLNEAVVLGGSSCVVSDDNIVVRQRLERTKAPIELGSLFSMVSDDRKFAAMKAAVPVAHLNDTAFISFVDQSVEDPVYFLNTVVPFLVSSQKLPEDVALLLNADVSKAAYDLCDVGPGVGVKYLTEGTKVAVKKLLICEHKSEIETRELWSDTDRFIRKTNRSDIAWRRVFLQRGKEGSNTLINTQEFSGLIEKDGFEQVHIDDWEPTRQAQFFRESKYIVTFPGKALVNMMYCSPGTHVLLLDDGQSEACNAYKQLGDRLGIHVYIHECVSAGTGENRILWLDLKSTELVLANMLTGGAGVNAKLDDLANVYTRQLMNLLRQAEPLALLDKAIRMATQLVIKTRDVGYMMIHHAFNDAAGHVFENVAAGLIPSSTTRKKREPSNKPSICILATQMYDTGGHTRVIEDMLASLNDECEVSVLLTNYDGKQRPLSRPAIRWPKAKVYTADSGSVQANIKSIHALFEKLDPDVVINMSHPFDVIAYGFMMREKQRRWLFGTHADHTFSFFPKVEDVEILSITDLAAKNAEQQNVTQYFSLPLTCQQVGNPNAELNHEQLDLKELATLSVGSEVKFRDQGALKYVDLLNRRFSCAGGRHVHVGPISAEFREVILTGLARPEFAHRLTFVPYVENVGQFIVDANIDLYLVSYPVPGIKSMIEAMAAGCPIACNKSEGSLDCSGIAYPNALLFSDLDEFDDQMSELTPDLLVTHQKRSMKHFEENHSPERFSTALWRIIK